MRFVLCEDDDLFSSMVEAMLTDLGHVVVGVGTTAADSVSLVEAARPDVVILDLSLGFNSDFDVVETATEVGAVPIIFSQNVDDAILRQYQVRPTVVFKPDLPALERVVQRLGIDSQRRVVEHDRRRRPAVPASGPTPTSISDAQAFYEALNQASAGDALLSIEVPGGGDVAADTSEAAIRVQAVMRDTDRPLASWSVLWLLLPAASDVGIVSFRSRLDDADALPAGATIRSVVIAADESPADAFERLKSSEPDTYTPKLERSPSTDHSASVT